MLILLKNEKLVGVDLADFGPESLQVSLGDAPFSLSHSVLVQILGLHLEKSISLGGTHWRCASVGMMRLDRYWLLEQVVVLAISLIL